MVDCIGEVYSDDESLKSCNAYCKCAGRSRDPMTRHKCLVGGIIAFYRHVDLYRLFFDINILDEC